MRKKVKILEGNLLINSHIATLIDYMSEGIFEKQHIMAMSLLCAISGESIFLLGPPGTAKSMVARRLKMVFKDASAFEYLMSRFSTPDEIFGPVSISKLKNEDKYERLTDGYLPNATVVFLDEIWKAGPSIQNALLTAINEHIYQNGAATIHLPMKVLIAASNELPTEDEGLEALWDRFLVREVSNCISNENTFFKMIRQRMVADVAIPEEYLITSGLYAEWQEAIDNIKIPDSVCNVVSNIRKKLKEKSAKEDIAAMDYYISDRRWKKCFHLMQASAYLNGRNEIDLSDTLILLHCLWNKVETIPDILEFVTSSIISDIDKDIENNLIAIDRIVKMMSSETPATRRPMTETDDEYEVVNHFYYRIENYPTGQCLFSKLDYNHLDVQKSAPGLLYKDKDRNLWIIHAIYAGAPFDNKFNCKQDTVTKVQLKRCMGGIVINDIPYKFRRRLSLRNLMTETKEPTIANFSPTEIILQSFEEIKTKFSLLQQSMTGVTNLFVSDDDKKLIKRQIDKTEKQLGMLDVKIKNTQMLTNGTQQH